jgi:hypothetical protein
MHKNIFYLFINFAIICSSSFAQLANESEKIDSYEKAVQIAKEYLIKNKVDISNHDISLLPKIMRGMPDRSFLWRLWWPYTGSGKGGALIVIIYKKGKIEHRFDD